MATQEPKREDEPVVVEPARRRLHLREVRSDAREYDGIGSELRAARVRAGVELRDVAQKLRISGTYLDALESGRFADLPGDVYVFGFLRSYARFLNLDEQIVIDRYRSEAAGPRRETRLEFPSAMDRGRMPSGRLLLGGLVIAVVAYAAWFVLTSEERSTAERVAPVPDRLAAADPAAPTTEATRPADISVSSAVAGVSTGEPTENSTSLLDDSADAATPAVLGEPESPIASDGEVSSEANAATPAAAPAEVVRQPGAVEAEAAEVPAAIASGRRELGGGAEAAGGTQGTGTTRPVAAVDIPAMARTPAPPERTLAGAAPIQPASVGLPPPQQRSSENGENELRVMQLAEASSAPIGSPRIDSNSSDPDPSETPTAGSGAEGVVVAATQPAAPPPLASSADEDAEATAGGYVPRTFGAGNEGARIVLVAESDSWVQVRATTGELLLTRVLRPGDRYLVPDRPDLVMMTGNLGALRLIVEGESLPPLGPLGVIGRNIPLDAERLRNGQVSVRDEGTP